MKTTKPAVILLALVLLTAAAVQPTEAMDKPKISDTHTASCLVKITSDPAVLPLSDIVIDYLLHSSGVAGKAAREVLNISPDQASDLFTIEDLHKYSVGGLPPSSNLVLPRSSRPIITATRAPSAARTADARRATAAAVRTPTSTSSRRPRRPTTRPTTPAASPTTAAEQTILFKLQVGLPDDAAKPAAEEFMKAIINNLRSTLRGAFDEYRNKIIGQFELAAKEAHNAESKLVQMQKQLRNISDSRDLSRNTILNDIYGLRQGIQDSEMQKASKRIEMESIAKEIADTEVKVKEKVNNDPITIELQRIVDIQTDSLKRIQELLKQGTASSAQVEDVLEKLTRARIELAKRREEISRTEGGNRLNQLSRYLAEYTQQMAQCELSLSGLKEQLDEAMAFLDRADNYELLSLKADITRQSLQEALLWREQMDRKARLVQPPTVTVLGGS